jgi:hypothetical protein
MCTCVSEVKSVNYATLFHGDCSSVGRASDCGSDGRGFEPRHSPHFQPLSNVSLQGFLLCAWVTWGKCVSALLLFLCFFSWVIRPVRIYRRSANGPEFASGSRLGRIHIQPQPRIRKSDSVSERRMLGYPCRITRVQCRPPESRRLRSAFGRILRSHRAADAEEPPMGGSRIQDPRP